MTAVSAISAFDPKLRFVDNNGNALTGGKLFVYTAGTTTKITTYTDDTAGTPNVNPIILNTRGECSCFIPPDTLYKMVLAPSTDTDPPTNAFWTQDNIAQAGIGNIISVGTQGQSIVSNGTAWTSGYPALRGYLGGLTLSNDSGTPNTILDISAGQATDSTNAQMITLASAFTKSTAGLWVAGTGQNGMGTGVTVGNNQWLHAFAIINSGAPDAYLDTSVTAANKPTNTTAFRRLGSIKTDGSAHILPFTQDGDYFRWAASVFEINTGNPGTSAVTLTLGGVPTGVNVQALFNCLLFNNNIAGNGIYFSDLAATDEIPTGAGASGPYADLWVAVVNIPASVRIQNRTNTSAQVRYRVSGTTANLSVDVATLGWWDYRGRNA